MQIKSIADCSSIQLYIRPSLSHQLLLQFLFCLFLSGLFTQVLLYNIKCSFRIAVNVIISSLGSISSCIEDCHFVSKSITFRKFYEFLKEKKTQYVGAKMLTNLRTSIVSCNQNTVKSRFLEFDWTREYCSCYK